MRSKRMESVSKFQKDTPSAELLNQYRSWFSLGGTVSVISATQSDGCLATQKQVVGSNLRTMRLTFRGMILCHNQMHSRRSEWIRFPPHTVSHLAHGNCRGRSEKVHLIGDKATLAGLNQDERKQLSEGIDLERDNGDILQASQFRGPAKPATSIVVSGDTAEQSIQTTSPVTVLVHEATFLNDASDKASETSSQYSIRCRSNSTGMQRRTSHSNTLFSTNP